VGCAAQNRAVEPWVAVDPGGHGVAVWQQQIGGRHGAMAARFDAATQTWGTPVALDLGVADRSFLPKVGTDAKGRAIAVWYQLDTRMKYKIRANHLQ
jgi:hypothetical protein